MLPDETVRRMNLKDPEMGNSLLERRRDYVAVDIETTGLDPLNNKIIELAAIRIVNGKITEKFSRLVNPREPLSSFITGLTGITNAMLREADSIEEVLPHFLEFVGDSVVLGQNVRFDISFIGEACRRLWGNYFTNDYLDTLRISRLLFREHRHHTLADQVQRFGIGESVEHRALADAEQTYKCYEYMMTYMEKHELTFTQNKPKKREVSAKEITPQGEIDTSSPCCGKLFVFTGTLSRISREQAMQYVVNGGGTVKDSVVVKTDYLVLGKNAGQTKSTKQKRAEALGTVTILSEEEFLQKFLKEKV